MAKLNLGRVVGKDGLTTAISIDGTKYEQVDGVITLPSGGGSGGTTDHNALTNRDMDNQHPISAIEGLETALDNKQDTLTAGSNITIVDNVISSTGGSGGTTDHNALTNRDMADQHPISAVEGLTTALEAKADTATVNTALDLKADKTELPDVSGLATKTEVTDGLALKADTTALETKADLVGGKVPASQLPEAVDEIIEVADFSSLPTEGESNKIYLTMDDNKVYRWSGSAYVVISDSLALGETSSTAYAGDKGKEAHDLATANQAALALKADKTELTSLATKTEVSDGLALKADKTELPDVSGFIDEVFIDGTALTKTAGEITIPLATQTQAGVMKVWVEGTTLNIITE